MHMQGLSQHEKHKLSLGWMVGVRVRVRLRVEM
jgi:hypothetical protein